MAYQVLARKWRPARFDQVIGQEHVLKALTHALEQNRLHHAYLFSGTRGVGKTSIARLLAKGLNCETGITATPCEQCSHCREISEGRFVDLLEIDAASRTKVDDTREILDNVQYQPVRGRFKVYLIDEVHMLSRHSFNALLKTLEEPPPHVKFLLATTDPQKLPVTVLSRCLQFNLKSVPVSRISEHLATVLSHDNIAFEATALELLAQAADGSVRDGMSLTDQAIAHGGGQLSLSSVQAMLGTLDSSYALRLLQALSQGDAQALMMVLDEIEQFAPDHDDLLKQMASALHQMALCQFNVRSAALTEHGQQILALAQMLDREQVQLWYQMLTQGRADLKLAPDPRSGLEMVLLRALAFAPLEPAPPMAAPQPQLQALNIAANTSSSPASQTAVSQSSVSQSAAPITEPAEMTQAQVSHDAVTAEPNSDEDDNAIAASLHAEQAALLAQAQIQQGAPLDPQLETPMDHLPPEHNSEPSFAAGANAEPAFLPDGGTDDAYEAALAAEQAMILTQAEQSMPPQPHWQQDQGQQHTEAGYFPEPHSELPSEVAPELPAVGAVEPSVPSAGGAEFDPFQSLLDQALANHQNLQSRSAVASDEAQPEPAPEPPKAKVTVQTIELSNPSAPVPDQRPSFGDSGPFAANPTFDELAEQSSPAFDERTPPPFDDDLPPWALDDESEAQPIQVEKHVAQTPTQTEAQVAAPTPISAQESTELSPAVRALAANETDVFWYDTMAKLGIGARPRQLAVNSVLERDGSVVRLHLTPEQRHLNHDAVIGPLKEALTQAWGESVELEIIESHLEGRETPLMVRRRLHQERLVQARVELLNDPAVQWLQSQFDAKLIEESVGYQ